MSRNLPMSNSDLRKGSSETRYLGSTLVRIFAQRHVGHVEQPADVEVVGELLEVLGEMTDRQPRAGGVGVDGRRRDRQDARALAPAHHAVLGFAAAQRSHSLIIDDRVQSLFGQRIIFLDHRPRLLHNLVGAVRFVLIIEEQRFGDEQHDSIGLWHFRLGQVVVDLRNLSPAGVSPEIADFPQRRVPSPLRETFHHGSKPARIHRGFGTIPKVAPSRGCRRPSMKSARSRQQHDEPAHHGRHQSNQHSHHQTVRGSARRRLHRYSPEWCSTKNPRSRRSTGRPVDAKNQPPPSARKTTASANRARSRATTKRFVYNRKKTHKTSQDDRPTANPRPIGSVGAHDNALLD